MRRLLGTGSFGIGRWFGFQISIHYSWFVIFGLVLWSFSYVEFPRQLPGYGALVYGTMGVAGTLLFFLSVLLHELSHSAMARRRGIEVAGITLFIFGGVAQTQMEAEEPADEFLLTVVGPLCSLALAALFFGVEMGARAWGLAPPVVVVSSYLGWLNLILALFNLVPGFPLDGGRLFRSSVWYFTGDLEKATRWATRGGQGFGFLLVAYGAFLALQGALVGGAWAILIGWFLSTVAGRSWSQFEIRKTLSGVPVSRVMVPEPATIPAGISVREAVDRYFLRMAGGAYPVVDGRRLVGLLSVDDVAGLSKDGWDELRVGDVARSASDVPKVAPEDTLDSVLTQLQSDDGDRVLVVADGALRGVVTMQEIHQWLQRIRKLGLEEAGESGEGEVSAAAASESTPPSGSPSPGEGSPTREGRVPGPDDRDAPEGRFRED